MFLSNTDESNALSELLLFFAFLIICNLVVYIITSIAQMKILKKAGKEGWQAFIPIYNIFVMCQIVGVNPSWLIVLPAVFMVSGVIPVIGPLLAIILPFYFEILFSVSLSRAFGKKDSFAIGLLLFNPIFLIILAFNKNKYMGINPMKDYIFDALGINNKTNNDVTNIETLSEEVTDNKKYCSNCGALLHDDYNYCQNCGNRIY